jgi:tetratricopeptide (TPR) repeat protein
VKWLLERIGGLVLIGAIAAASPGCPSQPQDPLAEIRELHRRGRFAESVGPLRALLDEDPGRPEANYLLGAALLRTGDASVAMWPLRKAAESPDYAVDAGILLARAMLQGRSTHDAIAAADRVLTIEPDNVAVLELRVQAQVGMTRYEEALVDIDRVLELDPENINVPVSRVLVLIRLDRIEDAEAALETATHRLETTEREVTQTMRARLCIANGMFAFEKGDAERGEAQYEECLAEYPTDPLAVPEAASFFDRIGKVERATEILQRAFDESKDPAFRTALARRMRRMGKLDEEERLLREGTEERPSAASWFALADHYVRRGDFDAACGAFEEAIAASENPSPMIRFAYGDTLVLAGEYEKAEQVAASLEQSPPLGDLIRGRSLLAQGDARGALLAFDSGIRLWPNNAASRFLLAQAAEQLGDFDRALAEYRESLRSDPAHTEAGLAMARLYEAEGNDQAALDAVGRYARNHRADPEGYRLAIRIAHRSGRHEVVVQGLTRLSRLPDHAGTALALEMAMLAADKGPALALQAVDRSPLDLTDPANAAALRVLLEQLAALEEHETARARVAAALAAHPDAAEFHDLHARALRASGEPRTRVREAFERAIELDPEHARALAGLAELSAEAGERQAALALYDRAAAADPADPAPAYAASQLPAPERESEGAQRRLEELLRQHPHHARAANDLARILAASGGDLDRALELAQRAVRFRTAPGAPETLGWILLLRGEPKQAIEALTRALELRPEDAMARYRLGLALVAEGDEEGAQTAFREVLETEALPEPEAEHARGELARLEGRRD